MKRIFIIFTLIFVSSLVFAQKFQVGVRDEIFTVEEDDNEYAIFGYMDEDGTSGYYLGLGRPDVIPGAIIAFDVYHETCVYLGATLAESLETMGYIVALFNQSIGSNKVFDARLGTGELLKDKGQAIGTLERRIIVGKHISFSFKTPSYLTESFLNKITAKSLLSGLKTYIKIHPKQA